MKEIQLRRSELYAMVWSKAVQQVAAGIGVSDVALAKACRKHGIPLPGRGLWARQQHGHRVKRSPLPHLPDGDDPVILFHVIPKPAAPPEISPEVEFEQRPENRIAVPETIDQLHRTVRHTRARLARHKADQYGLLRTSAKDCFNVGVSAEQLDRTCRILHALVTAFEIRGYRLVEGDDAGSGLRVDIDGEHLTLTISERVKREALGADEVTSDVLHADMGWRIPGSQFRWQPTGQLRLQLPNSCGFRVRWGDRLKQPLELRLNEVVAALAESAVRRKRQRAEAAREAEERAREQRRQEEARKKAELDRARFRRLERLVRVWHRREAVAGFLAAVKERMKDARPELVPTAQAWIDWAEDYLDRHRPVDQLFFLKLTGREGPDFYRWSSPFGERDDWNDEWGW